MSSKFIHTGSFKRISSSLVSEQLTTDNTITFGHKIQQYVNPLVKISQHNKKLLGTPPVQMGCHCRDKTNCPLPGKCTTDKVVYRATVTINDSGETYVWVLQEIDSMGDTQDTNKIFKTKKKNTA